MQIYKLYLESGPRKKKTMVHLLDLVGCIAKGPTTDLETDVDGTQSASSHARTRVGAPGRVE